MSNILFLILATATSFAFAAPKADIEITLMVRTNSNSQSINRIQVKGTEIFFDAEKIDPVQTPLAVIPLRRLSQIRKDSSQACAAGTYTHLVKRGKKNESKATGCLDSIQASELLQSMDQFKELHIIRRK